MRGCWGKFVSKIGRHSKESSGKIKTPKKLVTGRKKGAND